MDGDNLRDLPLSLRKTNPARLHRGRPDGIFINDLKQREIGPELFRKACEFGLEELVSRHRDRPCRSGREKHWKSRSRIGSSVIGNAQSISASRLLPLRRGNGAIGTTSPGQPDLTPCSPAQVKSRFLRLLDLDDRVLVLKKVKRRHPNADQRQVRFGLSFASLSYR
jgi:hypothetical protein